MAYRTYAEWQARGRYVIAGEKAMGKLNDGTAIFGKEQTKKIKASSRLSNYTRDYSEDDSGDLDYGMDWDEVQELGLDIGLPGQW